MPSILPIPQRTWEDRGISRLPFCWYEQSME